VVAFLEGRKAVDGALVAPGELVGAAVAVMAEVLFGPDADNVVGIEEETELVGEVEVGFVVGRGREQDAATGVAGQVIAHRGPAAAFTVPEVVAFVNDDDPVAAEVGQAVLRLGDGNDLGNEAVAVGVVFPHADQVFRAEDEGFKGARRVLKHAGQRGGHEGLAEADDVAQNDAAALFQVAGRNADRSGLKFQQGFPHVGRDGELGEAGESFLGEVVGRFDVDVIGRGAFGPGPAFVNDLDEFPGDVHAPSVGPAIVEPLLKFPGGVLIEDVHVEFTLIGQAGEGEVAGAEKASDGVVGIGAEAEVKFGVKGVAEEELHDHLAGLELGRQAAETGFIVIGRGAESELGAKLFGETALQADDGLLADLVLLGEEAVGEPQLVLGEPLHADEQAALGPGAARPLFDEAVNGFPAAQIEVTDAEIGTVRDLEGISQRRKEFQGNVVKDAGHGGSSLGSSFRRDAGLE